MTRFFRKQPFPQTNSTKAFLTNILAPPPPPLTPKSKKVAPKGGKSKVGKSSKKLPIQKNKITDIFNLKVTKMYQPEMLTPATPTQLSLATEIPETPAQYHPEPGPDPVLQSHNQGDYHNNQSHISRTSPSEPAKMFSCNLCEGHSGPAVTARSCRGHVQL